MKAPTSVVVVRALAALLVITAIMRWFGTPNIVVFVGLVGLTPFTLAPAWLVFAYGVAQRRRGLAVVAIPLLLLHASWTLSDVRFNVDSAIDPPHDIRIATANILLENSDPVGAVLALVEEEPDIILLQEVPAAIVLELRSHPALEAYQWSIATTSDRRGRRMTFSRVPLDDLRIEPLDPASVVVATVSVSGVPIEIVNVHLTSPLGPRNIESWERQLRELSARVHQRSEPIVLAGDFNATVHHAAFRILMEKDLLDAHVEVGRGPGFTWGPPVFGVAVMRLDHVLSTAELEPVRIRRLPANGSDHRPLVVDYQIVTDS